LRSMRDRLRRNPAVFSGMAIGGQILIIILALIWLQILVSYMLTPQVSQRSPKSGPLLYAALAMVAIGLGSEFYARRNRFRFGLVTTGVVLILITVSNQFLVIYKLGDGQVDKEFRMLTDWYEENAMGQKLVTTLPQVVSLYDQSIEPYMVRTSSISGSTLDEFVRECYRQGIGYIAWDSRIGLFKKDAYYEKWRMGRLAELQARRDVGRLEYVITIRHTDRRYINIYKLRPPTPTMLEEEEPPRIRLPSRSTRQSR
jgi:hypothetical protein